VITSPAFAGKHYAVLGLARSGLATVEALLASGAKVTAWDGKEEARAKVQGDVAFADPVEIDLTGFAGVVVSPGVPLNKHPIAGHAAKFGVPVISDIELFAQARPSLPPHKVVGITGTNGKSTTTALIKHIVETAGIPTLMGGNIGLPILGRDPLAEGGVYVLELSSYQIDITQSLDCDVAVLTNITPDHLDRYDGFAGYAASKERLFDMQSAGHAAIFTGTDLPSKKLAKRLANDPDIASIDQFNRQDRRNCVALAASGGKERKTTHSAVFPEDQAHWPALQGPHNAENAAAAIAVGRALGISADAIDRGLRTYPGLPHRMQRVAEKAGVLFVNDSKATNATATAPALGAYPKIHWILGGLPKTDDLDDCAPYFDHVVAGYTIGDAGPMFARILREAGKPVTESVTLDQAVADAAAAARPGEVVMLSPACASFDQFSDYEARGDAFRRAVEGLSL
jgi:UDP-N-acetylmuramoylalanine--D-glutamate ligase